MIDFFRTLKIYVSLSMITVSLRKFKFIRNKPLQNFIVNVVKAIVMFALIKLLAVYGGPASLASFANFQNLIGIMLVLATLSLQTGLTIETAKNASSLEPLITCICIIFLLIPFILFAVYFFLESLMLANDLLSTDSYFLYLTILFLPFSANSLLVASEVGRQRYSNILVNYVLIGIFPLITFVFAKNDFLDEIITGYCFGNWVGAIFLCRRIGVVPTLFFNFKVSKKILVSMLRYGMMSGIIGIMTAILAFIMRYYLTEDVSLEVAGYWESLFKIGLLFQFCIATPLISTGLPLMVLALKVGKKDIISLLKGRIKTLFILTVLSITFTWMFSDWIVLFLFSEDFLPISQLIVLMIFSECLKATGGILLLVPMAARQLGIVFLTYLISTMCIFVGLYLLSDASLLTLQNVVWLYLGSSFVHFILICVWVLFRFLRRFQNHLDRIA